MTLLAGQEALPFTAEDPAPLILPWRLPEPPASLTSCECFEPGVFGHQRCCPTTRGVA